MKVYVDLDDFCDEYAPILDALMPRILDRYPRFKATLFTIPKKTKDRTIWDWKLRYPSVFEFAVHGIDHEPDDDWRIGYQETLDRLSDHFFEHWRDLFAQGFKAPWWKLSPAAAAALCDKGLWVAVNAPIKEAKIAYYDYKTGGCEILPDICYEHGQDGVVTWHGHVQTQRPYSAVNPNGIGDVIEKFLKIGDSSTAFGFASEVLRST